MKIQVCQLGKLKNIDREVAKTKRENQNCQQ